MESKKGSGHIHSERAISPPSPKAFRFPPLEVEGGLTVLQVPSCPSSKALQMCGGESTDVWGREYRVSVLLTAVVVPPRENTQRTL